MAAGSNTYQGLAVPIYGNSTIAGQTAADTVLTLQGASGQTGRNFVVQSSAGVERFAIGATNFTHKWTMGTVALATLASNAAATVALTGLTTNHVVMIFQAASNTSAVPMVYANAADKLGYCAPAVATAAMTVNYLALLTV